MQLEALVVRVNKARFGAGLIHISKARLAAAAAPYVPQEGKEKCHCDCDHGDHDDHDDH